LDEWVEARQSAVMSKALKLPVEKSLEEKFGFELELQQQMSLHKYRNRKGGANKLREMQTYTVWTVDMSEFLVATEKILIKLRIHSYVDRAQRNAIWRTRDSK